MVSGVSRYAGGWDWRAVFATLFGCLAVVTHLILLKAFPPCVLAEATPAPA